MQRSPPVGSVIVSVPAPMSEAPSLDVDVVAVTGGRREVDRGGEVGARGGRARVVVAGEAGERRAVRTLEHAQDGVDVRAAGVDGVDAVLGGIEVNQMSVKPSRLTQEPSWKPESMSPVVSNGLPPAATEASAQVSPVGRA